MASVSPPVRFASRAAYARQLARYHDALRRRLLGWGGDLFVLEAERSPPELIEKIAARGTVIR